MHWSRVSGAFKLDHHLSRPGDGGRYVSTENHFTKSFDPTHKTELPPRSIGQTYVHYLQLSLACVAVTLFLAWLGLLAWEITYRQILIEDYLSGILSWVVILMVVRRFVIFTFARPRRPTSHTDASN